MRGERSFISYVISGRGRVASLCECFTIGKVAASSWLQVEIFDLLCTEDFWQTALREIASVGQKQTPGSCYRLLVLPDVELEEAGRQNKRLNVIKGDNIQRK